MLSYGFLYGAVGQGKLCPVQMQLCVEHVQFPGTVWY